MALVSSKVAAGMSILADQFNKLWADLTANHDHSSGQGGTVDHSDLSEGTTNMSGMNHRHQDVDYHLVGGGPGANEIDNPGGDKGIHGLHSAAYAAGSLGYIISGTPTQAQLVIMTGYVSVSGNEGTVSFSGLANFSVAPHVTIGVANSTGGTGDATLQIVIHTVTTSGFSWVRDGRTTGLTGFYWMAVGKKA